MAQKDSITILSNPTNKATSFGIGTSSLYDTYLSILEYKGTAFRVMDERRRQTSWFNGNFEKQQVINLDFSVADNPAKNASEYWILLDYSIGGHYKLYKTHNLKLSGGALWNTAAGVLYNQRNSNNPASARAYSNIQLSVLAFYDWKQLTFRWQMDAPVVGALFSPEFGQSYYEMSLGNTSHIINFASLHNQRALRNYISVDIPFNKFALRIGYLGSFYQTKVNNITAHTYSNNFMIGIVSESINLSLRKKK